MKQIQVLALGLGVLAASLTGLNALAADSKPAAKPAATQPADKSTAKPAAEKPAADAHAAMSAPDPAGPVSPETVVLRVNGTELKQAELDKLTSRDMAMQMRKAQEMGQSLAPDQISSIRKLIEAQVIEIWTNRQVLNDAIKGYDIKVDPKKVDETVDQLRKQAASNGIKIEDALTSQNMTMDSLRGEISNQLKLEDGIQKLVVEKTGSIDPKPEDLQELRTSHILIGFDSNPRDPSSKPPTDDEKAAKKKKAEDVLAQVKAGGDFAELAKKNSTSPDAAQGGDLDFHPRGWMVPTYDEAAWKLKDGEISDVVESPFGFHIIKVTGHRTNDSDENKEQVRKKTMSERIPQILGDLRKTAKIEDLRPESDKAPMGMPGMGGMAPDSDVPESTDTAVQQ